MDLGLLVHIVWGLGGGLGGLVLYLLLTLRFTPTRPPEPTPEHPNTEDRTPPRLQ